MIKYSDVDDAMDRANATEYGLGGSVWTKNVKEGAKLADQIAAGTVWVNEHAELTGAPFGGYKQSGLGRELGKADISTFTESQTLSLTK